jgi:hypothetical protein
MGCPVCGAELGADLVEVRDAVQRVGDAHRTVPDFQPTVVHRACLERFEADLDAKFGNVVLRWAHRP